MSASYPPEYNEYGPNFDNPNWSMPGRGAKWNEKTLAQFLTDLIQSILSKLGMGRSHRRHKYKYHAGRKRYHRHRY
jgi:hypothetical protein